MAYNFLCHLFFREIIVKLKILNLTKNYYFG